MKIHLPALAIEGLSVFYHQLCVLSDISFQVERGKLLAIAGPNGGGKTTLLKSILQLIPSQGKVIVFGSSVSAQKKRIAYIPQRLAIDWDFPAAAIDIVLMGRYHHIGWFWRPSQKDRDMAYDALAMVGMGQYANRHIRELSGGQQQRIFIARALVQQADLLLFDEPFIGIDVKTEQLIVDILQRLRSEGKTIIVVHHDLHTLADYFDWVLLLNKKQIAYGPVSNVCMPEYICATYGDRVLFSPRTKN